MGHQRKNLRDLFSDKKQTTTVRYSKKKAGLILSIVSTLMCFLSVVGIIILNHLSAEYENGNILRDLIAKNPVISAIIMVAICSLQVIIAFIPGEVVEVAAGYAFGAWWGAILCTFGVTVGSVLSILLARRYGRSIVEAFYPEEKLDSVPVLSESKKRNVLVAILFLIPGTPKDLLTYIIGLTEMSLPAYIVITTVCRFPSIIMSTISGNAMGEQKWITAIYFFIITGVLSGTGYLIYIFIRKRISKRNKKTDNSPKNDI